MEVLGTWEMQNICVAGYPESLLDCRSFTKKEVFLILSVALFAIRRMKTFSTFSSHVFLQGNSGMPSCSP